MNRKITQTTQVSRRETADRKAVLSLSVLLAFVMLIGVGSAWAQVDPCSKTYNVCSGSSVVLTHDANCGNGGNYVWAAFEDDCNYYFNGVRSIPSYAIGNFGGDAGGGIGAGWGDGENEDHLASTDENRCHYPGSMTVDIKNSNSNDPYIYFELPAGTDPNIYKYFIIRYRVNQKPADANLGNMEVFFFNANHTTVANPSNAYRVYSAAVQGSQSQKCVVNNYQQVVFDASLNTHWAEGAVTGFRLDPISYNTSGGKQVHMSIDYIALVAAPPAPGNASFTLNNVTANTTMRSYQVNNNGVNTLPVTQQANSNQHMHNAAGVIYYGWTSTESIHDVQVYPALNAGAIATDAVSRCEGDNTAVTEIGEVTAASHEAGATLSYKWYVSKDGGTPAVISGATSNLFTPDITNYTVPGTYVFTREVISDLCEASPKTSEGSFTLTVKAKPTMTVSNQTFYTNDGDKTVNFTSTPAGATFAWTNDNTAIGLAASGTDNISFTPATSGSDDEVATITVTPTLDGCTGDPETFTITVKNSVTMNDITDYMHDACSGTELLAAFTSEMTGVTYNWSHINTNVTPASGNVGSDGVFSVAFSTTATTAQTVTINVTPTKVIDGSPVNGPAKTFEVTIYPLPTVSITDYPTTVCPGGTTSFTGTVTTTATGNNKFEWYDEGDGFLIADYEATQSATTHTTTATAPTPSDCNRDIDIYLKVTDGNGCAATDTKTVSVKDNTAPTIGDFTVPAAVAEGNCQYSIPDLEDVVLDNTTDNCSGTITWVGQTPDAGDPYNQTASAQNITVTVKVKDACGNEQTKDVTVTIPANTLNPAISASATCICLGGIATFSATEGYSSYSWSAGSTNAGLPATTNTSSITVTPTGAGEMSYTVTVTGDNGCSKPLSATLTVKPLPNITANPATQNITYGDNITTVQITAPTGATVTTTTLPDGLTYASSAISGKPTNVGNYTITASATVEDCTASTPITINVGKKPLTITYTGADFVYNGEPVTVNYNQLTYDGLESGDAFTSGTITTDGYRVGDYYYTAGSFGRMWADYTATATPFGPSDITAKYVPTFNVKITITKRPLEITANSNSKEYDATPLTDPGYSFTNGTSLASTDQATVTVTGSQLCPGSSDNTVGDVIIMHDGDTDPVTDCYNITKVSGVLTVTPLPCPPTLDYNGNTYPLVQINGQCWFAENLREEIGDAVPFDEKSENTPKFGLLYNWTDALNGNDTKETDPCNGDFVQGACPDGWSLPSAADLDALQAYAHGMEGIRSDNPEYWLVQYLGNNATGFDERGAGLYSSATGRFEELKSASYFWTCESILNPDAYAAGTALAYVDEYYCSEFIHKVMPQDSKLSVRCIRKTVSDIPATSFNLEVNGPDKVSICASSTTPVSATYTAVLTPAVSPATYQWYENGSPVSGAQSATFVKEYTTADAGTAVIKCEVTADGTTKDGSVNTQILVKGPYSVEKTLAVCDCQLPYEYTLEVGTDTWTEIWTADNIVTDPTRSHTFVTADGCDSVVSITLTTWSAESETPTTCTSVTTYNSNETGNGSGLETVTDFDGNVYHVVQIGNQCWMKENLRAKHFANGNPLTGVTTVDAGNRADIYYTTSKPILSLGPCDAENLTMDQHTERYGLLYNWYTAMGTNTPTDNMHNVQGICPDGWHLPDTTEWHTLEAAIGMTGVHSENAFLGTNAIQIVTGCEWHESDVNGSVGDYTAFGRNATGFSARPAGCFYDKDVTETVLGTTWHKDDIAYAGVWCFFWSSTKYNKPGFAGKAAYNYDLHFDQAGISRDVNGADYLIGRSVRCIRNND